MTKVHSSGLPLNYTCIFTSLMKTAKDLKIINNPAAVKHKLDYAFKISFPRKRNQKFSWKGWLLVLQQVCARMEYLHIQSRKKHQTPEIKPKTQETTPRGTPKPVIGNLASLRTKNYRNPSNQSTNVVFGNWLNKGKRQPSLNFAYRKCTRGLRNGSGRSTATETHGS